MKTKFSTIQNAKQWILAVSMIFALSWTAQAQNAIYVQNTSGPSTCDGYALLDSVFATLPVTWINSNAMGTTLATNTFSVYDLCPGDYVVTFNTANGSMTVTFTVGSGSNPNPCTGFYATMTTTPTDINACTGTANIEVFGGTSPYSYSCNANTFNPLTNLCAGPISCIVTDANGCTSTASGYVIEDLNGGGNPTDTIIVILNNTFPANTITDSLPTTSMMDCTLDFDSIVSASITNVQPTPLGVTVTWTVYGLNGAVMATYDINYNNVNPNGAIYQATLVLMCGRSINMVQIIDQFEYIPGSSSISENSDITFSYINPMIDIIDIQFNQLFEGQLTLVDMKGAIIFSKSVNATSFQGNVQDLKQGIYMLQIQSKNNISSVRMMK